MSGSWLSAPLLWIVLPALSGLGCWLLRRRVGWMILLSTNVCLLLVLLAWLLPIGQPVRIAQFSFTVEPSLAFIGRRLILENGDRPFLMLIFLLCGFWFSGSYAAGANRLLVPFGMGMAGLLVAAMAVEPVLYAALLIEMVVLLSVPVLAPPGKSPGQGVLRFLIFQTLALPFILLAGWALAGVASNPTNQVLIVFATAFLALGFAFWLAVFPFYTWIPLLAEQSHPYATGFLFLILPTVQLLLGLNFLSQFGWLRALPNLYNAIGQIGTVMVVTAGIWSAFQKDLARLFGYGVIIETGYSLLALSLNNATGDQMFASMFLPRVICLGLWALSLSILLGEARSTRFEEMQGLAQKLPFATGGMAVAALALGGLPLLAVFPIHQVLLEELAGRSLLTALWALLGSIGMLFGTFRALAVLARGRPISLPVLGPSSFIFYESRMQIALLLGGIISLLLIGIFPQAFLPLMNGLLNGYNGLP